MESLDFVIESNILLMESIGSSWNRFNFLWNLNIVYGIGWIFITSFICNLNRYDLYGIIIFSEYVRF